MKHILTLKSTLLITSSDIRETLNLRQIIKTDQPLLYLIQLECYTTMIKPIDKLVGYRNNMLMLNIPQFPIQPVELTGSFDSFGPIVKILIQTQ